MARKARQCWLCFSFSLSVLYCLHFSSKSHFSLRISVCIFHGLWAFVSKLIMLYCQLQWTHQAINRAMNVLVRVVASFGPQKYFQIIKTFLVGRGMPADPPRPSSYSLLSRSYANKKNSLVSTVCGCKTIPRKTWRSGIICLHLKMVCIIATCMSISFLYRWRRPDLLYVPWMSVLIVERKDHCIINTVVKLCNSQGKTRLFSSISVGPVVL